MQLFNYLFTPNLEGFISRASALIETKNYCIDNISIEAFIDIFCVYECGRNGNYCEYYKQFLSTEIQLTKFHKQDIEERKEYIRYLLTKSNFEFCAIKRLQILGQTQTLQELAQRYSLVLIQ